MKKIFVFLLIGISGCTGGQQYSVSSRTDQYYITEFQPPKHFYVTLRRQTDGQYFDHVFVSKHCNNYKDNVWIGREVTISRYRYIQNGVETEEFDTKQLENCFCK